MKSVFGFFHLAYFFERFLLVAACMDQSVLHSFLWLGNIPLDRYTVFICSSVDGHLSGFHFSAVVNNAAVCTCVYKFCVEMLLFLLGTLYSGVELQGHTFHFLQNH